MKEERSDEGGLTHSTIVRFFSGFFTVASAKWP